MIYPFIYTRTKNYDYRVLTSKSLRGLDTSITRLATDIARTMIDADNACLDTPSWALAKTKGHIIWGMAILNKELGEQNKDKANRPVRGFFGLISDAPISRLPYDIAFFKELYAAFVTPIWESFQQTDECAGTLPDFSAHGCISMSPRANDRLNFAPSLCRVFTADADSKALLEAALAAFGDCSIATNLHKKSQCVEFGRSKTSFMNAVMAADAKAASQDIPVYVDTPVVEKPKPVIPVVEDTSDQEQNMPTCPSCGRVLLPGQFLCHSCQEEQKRKKYIQYGIYAAGAVVALVLIFSIPSFFSSKKHYSGYHSSDSENVSEREEREEREDHKNGLPAPLLTIHDEELTIDQILSENVLILEYSSSSPIVDIKTTYSGIQIIDNPPLPPEWGKIQFICKKLDVIPDLDKVPIAEITLTNEEGKTATIPVYYSAEALQRLREESGYTGPDEDVMHDGSDDLDESNSSSNVVIINGRVQHPSGSNH